MPRTRRNHPEPLIWSQPPPPPRQRALDRETIVRAAIEVADLGGLPALTMSTVASRLGPYTSMALYRYVHSKEGLTDLMLDAATAEIPIPGTPSGDWRSDLHRLAMDTWAMVRRHGWYAQLVHTRPPVGPHMMRRTEFSLSVLVGQGMSVATAMSYTALIDRHVFGNGLQAAEEDQMRERYGLDSAEEFVAAIESVRRLATAEGHCPHLAAWLAEPTGPTVDEQVELGLACLLDGIAARLPRP
ncbi:TetR/AcrR family transcriptional regulator [Nonomuraea purpurea]|uniref:TetR/AcrR family transcriptional regulator n=1 Tax=Nonomuraea purpurea TaxID=1849276 RepID=A0ABV8GMG5_9ACTN